MSLNLLDIYNEVAGQAWSMFDGEIESQDEFESSLKSSIQKALSDIWCSYPFPFTLREAEIKTVAGQKAYDNVNGNIIKKKVDGDKIYMVRLKGGTYLEIVEDYGVLDDKTGTPSHFYIKNDRICLYPIPDDEYTVEIDYQTLQMGKNKKDEPIFELSEDTDIVDIPEKYEKVFKNALITLSMVYGIADETDENYSSYKRQYQRAYKILLKFTKGINKENRITW